MGSYNLNLASFKTRVKNVILSFAIMWMVLEDIMLSEISQTQKDKGHTTSLVCEIQKSRAHWNGEWDSYYCRLRRGWIKGAHSLSAKRTHGSCAIRTTTDNTFKPATREG